MFAFLQHALEQPPETHCCYTKGPPLLPPPHRLIYAIIQNSQTTPPLFIREFFTTKISFAAKNLLCQKASFWHKPERCVHKEIIQQLLKLSFTSVTLSPTHWRNLLMVQIRFQDLFGDVLTKGLWFWYSPAAWLKANQFILQREQFCSFATLTLNLSLE